MATPKPTNKPSSSSSTNTNSPNTATSDIALECIKKCVTEGLVINDCSGYPPDVPFCVNPRKPHIKWVIDHRIREFRNREGTPLKTSFKKYNKSGIQHPELSAYIKQRFKIGNLTSGEDLLNQLETLRADIKNNINKAFSLKHIPNKKDPKKDVYYLYDVHHCQPGWAGGSDEGINMFPIYWEDHDKIHVWWDAKLELASKDFTTKLDKCISANTTPEERKNANQMLDCFKTKKGLYGSFDEGRITAYAECIKKQCSTAKVTPCPQLTLDITCNPAGNPLIELNEKNHLNDDIKPQDLAAQLKAEQDKKEYYFSEKERVRLELERKRLVEIEDIREINRGRLSGIARMKNPSYDDIAEYVDLSDYSDHTSKNSIDLRRVNAQLGNWKDDLNLIETEINRLQNELLKIK